MKYDFRNDYSTGAHPRVLEALGNHNASQLDALWKRNEGQEEAYGLDRHCKEAARLIKNACGSPNAAVHFVSGGTQANLIVLSAILRPSESVIASASGHINRHEAGAIEATGHKINAVQTADGKLTPEQITRVVADHSDEHMVRPAAVYLSQSTELGTVYKKAELEAIEGVCRKHRLWLYIDGARLGAAAMSDSIDMVFADLCAIPDIFYIGGTKNGALFGEAIVINEPTLQDRFRQHLKRHGALLAKGWFLGLQFAELFKQDDNLYFPLATRTNGVAWTLARGIRDLGYDFLTPPETNLLFPIFPNPIIEKLEAEYGFYRQTEVSETHSAIRLVTSWATPEAPVFHFLDDLKRHSGL